ncbi:uncharacterized protein [Paramisgurnus dabryanus]|uniref:uncharacterized protein n=1 Tax=Paramisgurnus dabryanus TaxID=90735 RepID=UPI003CCF7A23
MFALVEWNEEADNESWSIVPTSHIKNFDNNKYLDGLDERSVYLIEWRAGLKKKPRGGWPLYEAKVHKVAERQSTLEKLMSTKCQSSPKLLSKRKCRPNPKFEVETSNYGPPSPKKRQSNGENMDRELLEKIKLHHGFSSATSDTPPSPTSCPPPSSLSAPPSHTSPSSIPPLPKAPRAPLSAPPTPSSSLSAPRSHTSSKAPRAQLSAPPSPASWLSGPPSFTSPKAPRATLSAPPSPASSSSTSLTSPKVPRATLSAPPSPASWLSAPPSRASPKSHHARLSAPPSPASSLSAPLSNTSAKAQHAPLSAPPSPASSLSAPPSNTSPKSTRAPMSAPSSPASSSSTSSSPTSSSPTSLTSPSPDMIAELKAENEALKMELDNLKTSVISQMPKLLSTMCKLEKWLEVKEQSPFQQRASPSTIQESLEIYPDSGVCVPKNVLWSANHANTPTTMARMLLIGVFDIDTLLKSNLRGNSRPKVSVLPPSSEEISTKQTATLMCVANKGFPSDWSLNWKVDGISSRSQYSSVALLEKDGLYSWSSSLTLSEQEWSSVISVSCELTQKDQRDKVTGELRRDQCSQ